MKTRMLLFSLLAVWLAHGSAQVTPTPVNPNPTPLNCYLQGYDLATLSSRDYWTFSIARKDGDTGWFIPMGMTINDIEKVEVSMAFCKRLPANHCKVNANSSFCQHVHLKNGSRIDVDMGDSTKTKEFLPLSGGNTGFELESNGTVDVNATNCHGNVPSIITFRCSPFSKWNDQNVTTHVVSAQHALGCLYEIEMVYNGSCYSAPTVSPGSCQIDSYDTTTIAGQPYWFAHVDHTVCYNGSEDDTCTIVFSFCHEIPKEEDSLFNLELCHNENAAVCQIGHSSEGNKNLEYNMGTFHDYTTFQENDNEPGFHMEVVNGSRPENGTICPHGFNTIVILNCEPNSNWPEDRDLTFFTHSVYQHPCQYILTLEYSGACIPVLPIADTPSPVGWIFIGLFLGAVVIYLVVGVSFQYFVKGARGKDVVPHYTFWSGVVGLIGDGFKYTLDVITCFRLKGTSTVRQPTGSSGVQYDQI